MKCIRICVLPAMVCLLFFLAFSGCAEPCSHVWGKWETTLATTCHTPGQMERACELCGKTLRAEIPLIEHTLDEGVSLQEVTCQEPGMTKRTCTVCGWERIDHHDPLGHQKTDEVIIRQANCTQEGLHQYHCSTCGETWEEAMPLSHDYIIVRVPATVWEDGYEEKQCRLCGTVGARLKTLPASGSLGLAYEPIPGQPGTCRIVDIGSCKDSEIAVPKRINGYIVVEIANRAFSGQQKVQRIVLPETVTRIGYRAFEGCTSLESFTIPASITDMGVEIFKGCTSLREVIYRSSFFHAKGKSILSEPSIERVVLDCERIAPEGLYGCKNIKYLEFSSSIQDFGLGSLLGCTGLQSLIVPELDEEAQTFNIFDASQSVVDIYFAGDAISWMEQQYRGFHYRPYTLYCQGELVEELTLSRYYFDMPDGAWNNCQSLRRVELRGVRSLGQDAFANCTSLEEVVLGPELEFMESYAFAGCISLSSIAVPDGVRMENHIFAGCTSLEKATLGKDVTLLSSYEFAGCTSLREISFGEGLNKISDHMFSGCTALKTVTVPGHVQQIGEWAFVGCTQLESAVLENGVLSLGIGAFYKCSALRSVRLPDTMEEIGSQAFFENKALQTVIWPRTLSTLGQQAFYGCERLEQAHIPQGVSIIAPSTFEGCGSLHTLTLPNTITEIGDRAFYLCEKMGDVELPSALRKLGDSAFEGCVLITKLHIPAVERIGDRCFAGCMALAELTLAEGIVEIGDEAFSSCAAIPWVILPSSVQRVGSRAFHRCYAIKWIVVPAGVSFAEGAFYHCNELYTVYYSGEGDPMKRCSFAISNDQLTKKSTWYSYTEQAPGAAGHWWHYEDGVPIVW